MTNQESIFTSLIELKSKLQQIQNHQNYSSEVIAKTLLKEAIFDCESILAKLANYQYLEISKSDNKTLNYLDLIINREQFKEHLTAAIKLSLLANCNYVLCYFDLDQFRIINDYYGHVAGEKLLNNLSIFLSEKIRKQDKIAYMGGDEFVILLQDSTLSEAEIIAEKLRQEIENFYFTWQNKLLNITVSIGLVMIDANTPNWSYLMSAAESACQIAKQKGGNHLFVYRCNDQELVQQRSEKEWVLRLNQALQDNRFFLYAQKITPIDPNCGVDHYEILLRLWDEEGKIVNPGVFIPIAERYNLMPSIDRWVIQQFFSIYESYILNKPNINKCLYTINLSAASINNEKFLNFLKEQILSHNIPSETLCFEITETAAINNLDQAEHFIRTIKKLGCYFALDDFGTGMSSFTYLKNLSVDFLKIDGSFVKNIVQNPIDYVIVECFNQIGHAMDMKTIAEFVEEDAILAKLKEVGVDYAQGYGISRPSPLFFKNLISNHFKYAINTDKRSASAVRVIVEIKKSNRNDRKT